MGKQVRIVRKNDTFNKKMLVEDSQYFISIIVYLYCCHTLTLTVIVQILFLALIICLWSLTLKQVHCNYFILSPIPNVDNDCSPCFYFLTLTVSFYSLTFTVIVFPLGSSNRSCVMTEVSMENPNSRMRRTTNMESSPIQISSVKNGIQSQPSSNLWSVRPKGCS